MRPVDADKIPIHTEFSEDGENSWDYISALDLRNAPTLPHLVLRGTLVSKEYLIEEYDRLHEGPPGKARDLIMNAPSVLVEEPIVSKADKIRSMSDEELADFLGNWASKDMVWRRDSRGEVLGWLQESFDEDLSPIM